MHDHVQGDCWWKKSSQKALTQSDVQHSGEEPPLPLTFNVGIERRHRTRGYANNVNSAKPPAAHTHQHWTSGQGVVISLCVQSEMNIQMSFILISFVCELLSINRQKQRLSIYFITPLVIWPIPIHPMLIPFKKQTNPTNPTNPDFNPAQKAD